MKLNYYLASVFLLVVSTVSFSQKELTIQYSVINCEISSGIEQSASLRANSRSELFTELCFYSVPDRNGSTEVERKVNQSFKDLKTNVVWTLEDQVRVVREEMNLFNWKFSSQTDTILNYACKKAECKFRGRDYEAWFTTELPFRAAPWKLHGLPGVVLKVVVDDSYYILEAYDLSIKESIREIETPFESNKSLSWDQYVIAHKKQVAEYEKYYKSQEIQTGTSYVNIVPKIEIITEENKKTFDEMAEKNGLNHEL